MTKSTFRGYNRVKFQSLKLGRTVFCQSLILRDFLIHLEWDENVISYDLNPFKISVKQSGKRRIIKPHVLAKYSDQLPLIVWLKSIEADQADQQHLIKLITNFCEAKGFGFIVKTTSEVRRDPVFSNLKFLRRYLRTDISIKHSTFCREFFDKHSTPTLGDLLLFFKQKNINAETAYALLSRKIIESDIYSTVVNLDSSIKLKNQFPNFRNGRLAA